MKPTRCLIMIAVASTALALQPAQAVTIATDVSTSTDFSVYLKGNPSGSQLPDPGAVEQDIFLTSATGVNTGFGNVGSNAACSSGPCVNFTSTSLLNFANGGATISPNGSVYHDLTISVPGYTFGDFLFGVQLQKDEVPHGTDDPVPLYDLKITINGNLVANLTNPTVDSSGKMSFLALANGSAVITSLLLESTYGIGGVFGFDQTKDFQISELTCVTNCPPGGPGPSETPLPAAVWLFGTVLAGGAGVSRWRKRRQAQKAA